MSDLYDDLLNNVFGEAKKKTKKPKSKRKVVADKKETKITEKKVVKPVRSVNKKNESVEEVTVLSKETNVDKNKEQINITPKDSSDSKIKIDKKEDKIEVNPVEVIKKEEKKEDKINDFQEEQSINESKEIETEKTNQIKSEDSINKKEELLEDRLGGAIQKSIPKQIDLSLFFEKNKSKKIRIAVNSETFNKITLMSILEYTFIGSIYDNIVSYYTFKLKNAFKNKKYNKFLIIKEFNTEIYLKEEIKKMELFSSINKENITTTTIDISIENHKNLRLISKFEKTSILDLIEKMCYLFFDDFKEAITEKDYY